MSRVLRRSKRGHIALLALLGASLGTAVFACGSEDGNGAENCPGTACDGGSEATATDGPAGDTSVTDGGRGDVDADARDGDSGTPVNCGAGDAGLLDPSFGDGGAAAVQISGSGAYSIILQADGKAVLGGYVGKLFTLARLTPTGAMDTTFGDGGVVETPISNRATGVYALASQEDGKIVAAGSAGLSANLDFVIVRYSTAGVLDGTFGDAGVTSAAFGSDSLPASVVVLPDGHVLVSGVNGDPASPAGTDYAVARFNANGALDTGFGSNGTVSVDIRSSIDRGGAMAVQPDGRFIVVGGSSLVPGGEPSDMSAVRFNADGSIDTSFGTSGKAITNLASGELVAGGVALDAAGRIVLVGSNTSGGNSDIALVRLTSTGAVDATFGSAGLVTTDLAAGMDSASKVFVQADGKIVVAGLTYPAGGHGSIALARYLASGALDPAFGTGGKSTIAVPGYQDIGATGAALGGCGLMVAGPWGPNRVPLTSWMGTARFGL